jgi:hypothetical protein
MEVLEGRSLSHELGVHSDTNGAGVAGRLFTQEAVEEARCRPGQHGAAEDDRQRPRPSDSGASDRAGHVSQCSEILLPVPEAWRSDADEHHVALGERLLGTVGGRRQPSLSHDLQQQFVEARLDDR